MAVETVSYNNLSSWSSSKASNTPSTPYDIILTNVPPTGSGNILVSCYRYINIKQLKLSSGTAISRAYMFYQADMLVGIDFTGITDITGDYICAYCNNLNYIKWPKNVATIPSFCFEGVENDSNKITFVFPGALTYVSSNSLYMSSALKNVTITALDVLPSNIGLRISTALTIKTLKSNMLNIQSIVYNGSYPSDTKIEALLNKWVRTA